MASIQTGTSGPQLPRPERYDPTPDDLAVARQRADSHASNGLVLFRAGACASVKLISHSSDAERLIALLSRAYDQRYDDVITDEEIVRYSGELAQTRLQTPLDGIQLNFLINDVTRAWTHQVVRYRIGTSFVQQSMRFLRSDVIRIRIPDALCKPGREAALSQYCAGMTELVGLYHDLMGQGLHRQDARGVLPHDMLTSIWVNVSLRTLQHIYGQRTCCQVQHEEWDAVLSGMKRELDTRLPGVSGWLKTPWEMGRTACGFSASYDQPCAYADRFNPNR